MEKKEIDADQIIAKLRKDKKTASKTEPSLSEAEVRYLCDKAKQIFSDQPVLLKLSSPMKVCGDLFGNYDELLRIFKLGGSPPESNYLFLGNYVDKGKKSVETICLLFAYKIKYPEKIFLLRGNHESKSVNKINGFYDECKAEYNEELWETFNDVFNLLPIAATIDNKIFCVHGGLSPDLVSLDQIAEIKRPTDVPDSGILCDLLWSDPDPGLIGWDHSHSGVSYRFGPDIVEQFLAKYELKLICRSHQYVNNGYQFFANDGLVTLFSLSDYHDKDRNSGAIMDIDKTLNWSFQVVKPKSSKGK